MLRLRAGYLVTESYRDRSLAIGDSLGPLVSFSDSGTLTIFSDGDKRDKSARMKITEMAFCPFHDDPVQIAHDRFLDDGRLSPWVYIKEDEE